MRFVLFVAYARNQPETTRDVIELLESFLVDLPALRPKVKKISTVRNWFLDIVGCLKDLQTPVNVRKVKRLKVSLELLLLREPVKKAKLLDPVQMEKLRNCKHVQHAVTLALMLPSGSRFMDASRMLPSDFITLDHTGIARLRIFQSKSIRTRLRQRWLTIQFPLPLLPFLSRRIAEAAKNNEPLVTTSYNQFLSWLKKYLKDPHVTTYSIRRAVFESIRLRVKNIDEFMMISMHINPDSLRWYLDAPLPDEEQVQLHASSWHLDR